METAGKTEPRASAVGAQRCPHCGAELVSRLHYAPGKGYTISWHCPGPHCGYRRLLL